MSDEVACFDAVSATVAMPNYAVVGSLWLWKRSSAVLEYRNSEGHTIQTVQISLQIYIAHIRSLMALFYIKIALMHLYMLTPLHLRWKSSTFFSPQGAILREYWYISWARSTKYVSRCIRLNNNNNNNNILCVTWQLSTLWYRPLRVEICRGVSVWIKWCILCLLDSASSW